MVNPPVSPAESKPTHRRNPATRQNQPRLRRSLLRFCLFSGLAVSLGSAAIAPSSVAQAPEPLPHPRMPQVQHTKQPGTPALPQSVAQQILQDMAKRSGTPADQLRISRTEAKVWNGCLGVAEPGTPCTKIGLPGWRVTVNGGGLRWVYHATESRGIQLNGPISVSRSLVDAAIADAARRAGRSPAQMKLQWAEQTTWPDGCLGIPRAGMTCTQALVPGWKLVITNELGQTKPASLQFVYHTGLRGSRVVLDPTHSSVEPNPPAATETQLPRAIATAVINDMATRMAVEPRTLKIVAAEQRGWDGCFGLAKPGQMCIQIAREGWRVVVETPERGGQRWVYHTGSQASEIGLNGRESLPPAIAQAIVQKVAQKTQLPVSQIEFNEVSPMLKNMDCSVGQRCPSLQRLGWAVKLTTPKGLQFYQAFSPEEIVWSGDD